MASHLTKTLARRAMPRLAAVRKVQTVPKVGSEAEMTAEAVAQIRARIAYQKDLMASNPAHKSHAEEWKELWTWINISLLVCGPGVVFCLFKDLIFEEHVHRSDDSQPEYMTIRKKEFPWQCSECDLFDMGCWKKCRAEQSS